MKDLRDDLPAAIELDERQAVDEILAAEGAGDARRGGHWTGEGDGDDLVAPDFATAGRRRNARGRGRLSAMGGRQPKC